MLYKLDSRQYSDLVSIAGLHDCGCVYPLSIAEGFQKGDIFVSPVGNCTKVLFWTQSGFAYISGIVDMCFLNDVYEIMLDKKYTNTKRFLIMTSDKNVQEYFETKEDVCIEKRYLFAYAGDKIFKEYYLPTGYELREIDDKLLEKISGAIIPSLFWKENNDFLSKGKGYCISCGDDIVTWAFSAAVSTKEIDIGIETNPKYQQQGLGRIVAKRMIQYTIEQSKQPVWACHYKNNASAKMAEKLGFVKVSECSVIKKK